jgi:leader peptidase (prepilin peptidase) / N-methyltransferase
MPLWFILAFAALIGACVGSFLNVCIYRLPEEQSVIRPGSRCSRCSTPIGWRDNVPVVSYLLLRGHCRHCGVRISPQYAVVELVTAGVWAAAAYRYGLDWQALVVAVFFTLLIGIALTDLRTYIIPDEFTIGGTVLALALSLAPGGITFLQSVLGALAGFAFLYLAAMMGELLLKKPAMGGGDIKMMAMVGAFLGPMGAVLTIFLGALAGTIIFAPLALKREKLVPFGIFLAVGAAITERYGETILSWYRANYLGG